MAPYETNPRFIRRDTRGGALKHLSPRSSARDDDGGPFKLGSSASDVTTKEHGTDLPSLGDKVARTLSPEALPESQAFTSSSGFTIIRPTALLGSHSPQCTYDLDWYHCNIRLLFKSRTRSTWSVLPGHKAEQPRFWTEDFARVWHAVWRQAAQDGASLDSISRYLVGEKLVKNTNADLNKISVMVLDIIHWQTMVSSIKKDLGSAENGTLPNIQDLSKKPLYECLVLAGVSFPLLEPNDTTSNKEQRDKARNKIVTPVALNAVYLQDVGGLEIVWTNKLSWHLRIEPHTDKLLLFRCPTLCAVELLVDKHLHRTTLQACAGPPTGSAQWPTQDQIDGCLRETLLSYRLIFAQHKSSRKLFRTMSPPNIPANCVDPNLAKICSRKTTDFVSWLEEKDEYVLSEDFPILGPRLALLADRIRERQPKTWTDLWNESKDMKTSPMLWIVVSFIGTGILLDFVHTILQIIALYYQIRGS